MSKLKRINLGYVFITPFFLFIMLLSVYPMLNAVKLSFLNEQERFVGVVNFIRAFQDPIFRESVVHSIWFVVVSVVMHMGLGLILAVFLDQPMNRYYRVTIRTLILMPWAMPPVIVAVIWRIIFHPQLSPILAILEIKGAKWTLLSSPRTSLVGITIANIWFSLPFYMLIIMAGLQTIPQELYEAAAIDGAGAIQRFCWITIPGVRDIVVTLAIFDTIGSFILFDLSFVMTGGGPLTSSEVLPTYIYKVAFTRWEFNYGAAISILMFLIMLGFCSTLYLLYRRD